VFDRTYLGDLELTKPAGRERRLSSEAADRRGALVRQTAVERGAAFAAVMNAEAAAKRVFGLINARVVRAAAARAEQCSAPGEQKTQDGPSRSHTHGSLSSRSIEAPKHLALDY
jgi:hypothetical protein